MKYYETFNFNKNMTDNNMSYFYLNCLRFIFSKDTHTQKLDLLGLTIEQSTYLFSNNFSG